MRFAVIALLCAITFSAVLGQTMRCVNPCVNEGRPTDQTCFTPSAGQIGCCPTTGKYGVDLTGWQGAGCPASQADCNANYWVASSECALGCCYSSMQNFVGECQPSEIPKIVCQRFYEGGTFANSCNDIAECKKACCCYGTASATITYAKDCTGNVHGTFYTDILTKAACDTQCGSGSTSPPQGIGGDVDSWTIPTNKGYGTYISTRIYCFHDDRNDAKYVTGTTVYYNCPPYISPCPGTGCAELPLQECTPCNYEGYTINPICPPAGQTCVDTGTVEVCNTDLGQQSCGSTCMVNFTFNADWNNPKTIRYEGVSTTEVGCRLVTEVVDQYDIVNPIAGNPHSGPTNFTNDPGGDVHGPLVAPAANFAKVVDWDRDESQCTLLGGKWLTDADAAALGVNPAAFNGARCCGDDWIYINNRALDYYPGIPVDGLNDRRRNNKLCLYNVDDAITELDTAKTNALRYECKRSIEYPVEELYSYDTVLQNDDIDEEVFAGAASGNYFVGLGVNPNGNPPTELDIGKYGMQGDQLYCRHYFDNSMTKGDTFQWMTIKAASDLDQMTCELHLGYGWTGTKCCGDDTMEIYNDRQPECDAQGLAYLMLQKGYDYTGRQFEKDFPKACAQNLTRNGACYKGKFAANGTAVAAYDDLPGSKNIIAVNGTLYGCKTAGGSNIITESSLLNDGSANYPKCTDLSGNVCAYYNDSWITKSTSGTSAAVQILGYQPTSDPASQQVKESKLPFNASKECCLSGSCWNGLVCVPDSKKAAYVYVYNITTGFRKIPEDQWVDAGNMEAYICQNSTWEKAVPKYNWFRDTSKVKFCSRPYSCVCSESTVSSDMDDTCPGAADAMSCTKEPNYYKGDHYCEAKYSGSSITDSEWTSRTKLLALQMANIAGSQDYTLFCDIYNNAVNYPVPLSLVKDKVNSICTMYYGGKTVVGFSLNPSAATSAEMKTALTHMTNGIISTVFNESNAVGNCNFAVDAPDSTVHGQYKRCVEISSKVWYNNRTKTIIYSKTGLDISGNTMPMPDWASAESSLKSKLQPIIDHISANRAAIITAGKPDMETISYTTDYNRFYMASYGAKSVFAVLEKKYSEFSGEPPRNFLGAAYTGLPSITCADVTHAYPDFYCGTQNGKLIVLYKDSIDPEYWQDLTAKIRLA